MESNESRDSLASNPEQFRRLNEDQTLYGNAQEGNYRGVSYCARRSPYLLHWCGQGRI